jgi:hypothetical protein
MDKLSIQNEMACFDKKDRHFYDSLTDEERKKFSNFLMLRWGSSVNGSPELQEFYLIATNERLNKHFFAINKHPKLQWLCATAVSPDMGAMRHNWIAPKKKEGSNNEVKRLLMDLMPNAKMSDIDAMCQLVTKKEIKELLREHGHQD